MSRFEGNQGAIERAKAIFLAALSMAVHLAHASSLPTMAPAFLWSPVDYGVSTDGAKEIVRYQVISPWDLAKSVMDDGGWSNFLCAGQKHRENVDVALVFIGTKLQSSVISKDKLLDPVLIHKLKDSFTTSNFSIAFPYVTVSDEKGTMESSLIKGFAENCANGLRVNRIAHLDTCSITGQNSEKLHDLNAIHDFVVSNIGNGAGGQTNLIVFCNRSLKEVDHDKSEGEILSELVSFLEESGATYTILYASEPHSVLQYRSHLAISRFLAEGTNVSTTSNTTKCDRVCQIKSSLLEGVFVGIVLLIILISGLCCMMGIDAPTRFETPQES